MREFFKGTALTGKAQRWIWRSLLSKTLCLAGGFLELRSQSEIIHPLLMVTMSNKYEVITGPYLAGGRWDLRSPQSQTILSLLMATMSNQYEVITGPLRCGSCEVIRGKEQKSQSALWWLRWLSSQKRFFLLIHLMLMLLIRFGLMCIYVHIMFVIFYGDVEFFFVSSSIKHQMGSNNAHSTGNKIRNNLFFTFLIDFVS